MQYIRVEASGQLSFAQSDEFLMIPSRLSGFHNTNTILKTAKSGRNVYCHSGTLELTEEDRKCECGCRMHINSHPMITLRHLCIGGDLSCIVLPHNQLRCPKCGAVKEQFIPFKAPGHMITEELYQYTRDLLSAGVYTNKQVAEITGLGKNTVKDIDLARLKEKYTLDGKLKKPERAARILGIDEFKLHDGYRYATHIIDMDTGHVLWIGHGKRKQIVYDFIDHVGIEWMQSVEAVACDMNSDFQEAFEERCEWIQPVFDHFHLIKNFNEKVVSSIRKDEQQRLKEENNYEAARALKRTKYILTSSRQTLQKKDAQAKEGKILSKGSCLFNTDTVVRHGGYEEKYDALLKENKLLFTLDLLKEKLAESYRQTSEAVMASMMTEIMDICQASGNKHLLWFRKLIDEHFSGIIAHATYNISSGCIEGLNNKIKTLRRQGYGYPDDEYFFLKIFDISRRAYIRNPKSHRIND